MKKIIFISAIFGTSLCSNAQIISTIAGNGSQSYFGDGGQAIAAELYNPAGLGLDSARNVYIADFDNNSVRKVNASTGIIFTVAGNGTGGYSGDGGQATSAQIWAPYGVVIDRTGNIYIADAHNNRIRKVIASTGIITTIAGNGISGFSGDGGPATSAELSAPPRVALDASGDLYIPDYVNSRIRKVNSSGTISTIAGNGIPGYSGDGGQATSAEINNAHGIFIDALGNIYITDNNNNRIRKINSSGIISTIAGNGVAGYNGDGGQATTAELNVPTGVTVDKSGNVYIAGGNSSVIRKITASTGIISTIAGNGISSFSGDGGQATMAEINFPTDIALDTLNNFYIADQFNNRIRKVIVPNASCFHLNTTVPLNVNCNGAATGQAKVNASGGATPYTYLWSPGGNTTYTAGLLSAGVYTVTVIDRNGCSNTATATVTQPAAVRDSIASIVYPLCYGGIGSASIGVKGGVSPYTYLWSPNVSTTATGSNLTVRSYVVQVKDAKNCTSVVTFTITQPPLIKDSIVKSATINVNCNGLPIGSATVGVRYGLQPYTYSWTPNGSTTATATGLSRGTYTVTVKDVCGGSATAVAIITQSAGVTVTAAVGNYVTCNGLTNGLANVSVRGGTVPYTYSWSPGNSTTYLATGLSAGVYTVTVTDKNGCSNTSRATVTQPAALHDSVASVIYPPCNGATGSATLGVKGGTSPYTYVWSPNVSTTASATGLTARSYVVQVKDSHGCTSSLNVTITQPPIITLTHTVTCNGTTGTVSIGVSSGTTPYTYSWSPSGGSSSSASGLSAGTYTVHITTHAGCTATISVTITCSGEEPSKGDNDNSFGNNCCPGNSENMNVYPNPNTGQFTVSIQNLLPKTQIEIFNVLGERVFFSYLYSRETEINMRGHTAGIYFYRVFSENGGVLNNGKIVVQ